MKYISIDEFREFGYLQEINRQFLHPLGLALEIIVNDNGASHISGIWDCRDDPEGFIFDEFDFEKMQRVSQEQERRAKIRQELLGFIIQPSAGHNTAASDSAIEAPNDDLYDACERCHGEGQISVPTYPGSTTVAKRTCRHCDGTGKESPYRLSSYPLCGHA